MSTTLTFDLIARDRASDKFDKVGGSADGAGEKIKKFAKVAAVAGGAAATALGASLVGAMNIEAGTDKLAAQLGLTERKSERIGKVAGSLYSNAYGESMEHVNDAVGSVMSSIEGMGNASSKRLENVTAKALDFATAFEVDVNRAVQVAGQAVSSGLAKNATEAFDLITAASQKVPANLREDVLDAADEYGQFFNQLGIEGPAAFGMLVKGAEKGMYGIDKTGDAIKEFTIRSTDLSSASREAYGAVGLDAEKMTNKILAGGDSAKGATDKIISGLLGIKDPGKQAEAAIKLFGTPLEDLSTRDIPKFLEGLQGGEEAMEGFGGASKRMGDTLNGNASTALTGLKRKAELAFFSFSNKMLPAVEKAANFLGENFGPVLKRVGGFISDTVVPAVRDLVDRFTGASDGTSKFKQALSDAQPFIDLVKTQVKNLAMIFREVLWPIIKKVAEHALPAIGKSLGAVGKMGTWLWNNALQPAFKFIMGGVGKVMEKFGQFLQVLSKVPGFGWADVAGQKMEAMGRDAQDAANKIQKIPNRKHVSITGDASHANAAVAYTQRQLLNLQALASRGIRVAGVTGAGGFTRNARGTSHFRGGMTWVGEEGPELVSLPRGSRITPAEQSKDAGGGMDYRMLKRAFADALADLPIVRLPDAGQAAYLQTGGY